MSNRPKLKVLSLGAGVQSTALALMSIDGILPKVDLAIFSDTGWEPMAVYDHLERLTKELDKHGVAVDIVNNGNIRDDALNPDKKYASMPLHMRGPNGNGVGRRQCTNEYKLVPIKRRIRQLLGAEVSGTTASGSPKVGRVKGRPGENFVEMWVGISVDEIERKRDSGVKYIKRVDPLIDLMSVTRSDCIEYLSKRWPWAVERSACIGCPFHTNDEWRHIRDNSPEEFADAIQFDEELRSNNMRNFTNEAYLHSSRTPLSLADIDKIGRKEAKQLDKLRFEGCSPWGCSRDSGGSSE